MMKKAMLFVAALLACHVANAQYFCTTEGTELHYVNYDEVGQSVSDETMTVKNIIAGGKYREGLVIMPRLLPPRPKQYVLYFIQLEL